MQRPKLERDHILTGVMKGLRYKTAIRRHSDLLEGVLVTLVVGHWDSLMQQAYDEGATLVEADRRGRVVAVYRDHGIELKGSLAERIVSVVRNTPEDVPVYAADKGGPIVQLLPRGGVK